MEYGRYRILNQLGQGGMATVYLAEDPLLQRLVAVKVIQAHLSANSSLMDRFTVEAKTIAGLRHINIIEVFDFGVQDDQQFLVMEYIDGQNLQAIIAALAGKPFTNTVAAAIICQAAEGLTSAEKHGVVHRDIKPENLMFNSEGTLKIADFGIAHIADEQSRTQTGAVLGSPNFMSPEQIEGAKPTSKTDIFSLGGVFYYCLTGKMPFTGPSIPVTMRNICERQPPAILEANPTADPALIRLVDILLQKLPENRGDGSRWLANQLRSYLNQQGVVDVVDHVRDYISGLNLGGGGHTIAEPTTGARNRPLRTSSGSSMGVPASAIIRTGASTISGGGKSKVAASQSQFNTQATTGAMGPSSRSPLVWIGGLLCFCLLILAGAIIWTRLDHGEQPPVAEKAPKTAKPGPATASAGANSMPKPAPLETPRPEVKEVVPVPVAKPEEKPPVHLAQTNPHTPRETRTPRNDTPSGNTRPRPEPRPVPVATPKETPAEQTGFILIKSAPPFAALTINGKPQGETPMNAFMEVPVGKCHVEIVHRLSPPFDTVITISPGFRKEFKFKLDR